MAAVFRSTIPAALITTLLLLSAISSPSLDSQYEVKLRFTQDEGGSDNQSSGNNSSSNTTIEENNNKNWTAHLPLWNVGDTWVYNAILDAQEIIEGESSLDGAVLDLLYGTATMVVMGVEEMDVDGVITPVYRTQTSATVTGQGHDFPVSSLGVTIDGSIDADFVNVEYYRVGDLGLISYDRHMIMDVTAELLGIGQTIEVANYVESGLYSPPLEYYDFPLAENESWNLVTNLTKTYTTISTSDLVSLSIPTEPEYDEQEWSYLINATGNPGVSSCGNSTLVWMVDDEDEVEEWRWWCPAANNYATRWTSDIALNGINATLVLASYQLATPQKIISLEVSNNSTALNSEIDCWVNISDSLGNPISDKSGYLYLTGIQRISFITDENGSALLRVMVGNSMDNTPTADDWATHGIVAYLHSDQTVGSTTLTLEGSAIGGLLRLEANRLASAASEIMTSQSKHFGDSVRF